MTHTLKHTLGRSTPSMLKQKPYNIILSMISTVILPVVFSLVLSMISQWPTQVFSVPENKKLKNIANNQTFHGHSSFALCLPLRRAKFVLKFSIVIPHIYNKNHEYVQQMNNEICQSNIWSNISLIDSYPLDKFYFSTRFIKDIHLMGNN